MDKKFVYDLMERMEKSTLSRMELEFEGMRIMLDKGNVAAGNVSNGTISQTPQLSKESEPFAGTDLTEVKAKVAGTFYRAAGPDSDPFVKIGQEIHKGDVIGIIEAMKMMNDIISPVDGVVSEIFVENEQVVGYDQPLIAIDERKDANV